MWNRSPCYRLWRIRRRVAGSCFYNALWRCKRSTTPMFGRLLCGMMMSCASTRSPMRTPSFPPVRPYAIACSSHGLSAAGVHAYDALHTRPPVCGRRLPQEPRDLANGAVVRNACTHSVCTCFKAEVDKGSWHSCVPSGLAHRSAGVQSRSPKNDTKTCPTRRRRCVTYIRGPKLRAHIRAAAIQLP